MSEASRFTSVVAVLINYLGRAGVGACACARGAVWCSQAWASRGAVGSRSQGTAVSLAEALGPLLPEKEGWCSHCGPGGLWAGSPGVLTNVDGVLGRPRLAMARGLVLGAAWEAGPRQPESSGRISFLPGLAVRRRETPQAVVGVSPGWTLWSRPRERDSH